MKPLGKDQRVPVAGSRETSARRSAAAGKKQAAERALHPDGKKYTSLINSLAPKCETRPAGGLDRLPYREIMKRMELLPLEMK